MHQEQGCEPYAAHLEQSGDTVVMVERWTMRADPDSHAAGASLARLNEFNADLLERPCDVGMLDPVPLGTPAEGAIPLTP